MIVVIAEKFLKTVTIGNHSWFDIVCSRSSFVTVCLPSDGNEYSHLIHMYIEKP